MGNEPGSDHTIGGFKRSAANRPLPVVEKGGNRQAQRRGTTTVCAWCETLLVDGRNGVAYVVCSFCVPLVRAEMTGRMD